MISISISGAIMEMCPEDLQMRIGCTRYEYLVIQSATWGRTKERVCGDYSPPSVIPCLSDHTLPALQQRCFNQSTCVLSYDAAYQLFKGDPCPGYRSSLVVDYVCAKCKFFISAMNMSTLAKKWKTLKKKPTAKH